ncbi:MAG: DUF4476 domain-containing protein [Bacteroidia bacterium]|nr:DUF4476 domain-containing protein [Bacteroidia bacterium]MDW8157320.1 DUF4476 domain-containing protein [Bacteroidia bacterium]
MLLIYGSIFLLFFCSWAWGQDFGMLIFRATSPERIQVSLNNVPWNSNFEAEVVIPNVMPGTHNVMANIYDGRSLFYRSASLVVEPGFAYHYHILRNRRGEYIFSLQMKERIAAPYPIGTPPGILNCSSPISPYEFEQARSTLASVRFADTQKQIFRQIVEHNCLVTEQVAALLSHFSFENDKLEMAKYALPFVLDPQRYFTLVEEFRFEDSKNELLSYIRSYSPPNPSNYPFRPSPSPNSSNFNPPPPSTFQQRGPTLPNRPNYSNGYRGKIGCQFPVSEQELEEILALIRKQRFGNTQLNIAKQAAQNRCLTTLHIKRILSLLRFEDEKIEFANFAYRWCYDPDNYYLLADAFQFENSFQELIRRIRK